MVAFLRSLRARFGHSSALVACACLALAVVMAGPAAAQTGPAVDFAPLVTGITDEVKKQIPLVLAAVGLLMAIGIGWTVVTKMAKRAAKSS